MSKLKLGLVIIAACLFTSVSFAELFSFQNQQKQDAAKTPDAPPVLSASEFKSKVKTMGQQTQKNMLQQSQSNLQQQTSEFNLPNSPPGPPPQINPSQPSGTSSDKTNKPSANTDKPSAQPAETPQPPQPVVTPPPPMTQPTTTMPVAPSSVAPPAPTPTAPQQSQVYTGFGGSSQDGNKAGSSSTPQSGGWNVKY